MPIVRPSERSNSRCDGKSTRVDSASKWHSFSCCRKPCQMAQFLLLPKTVQNCTFSLFVAPDLSLRPTSNPKPPFPASNLEIERTTSPLLSANGAHGVWIPPAESCVRIDAMRWGEKRRAPRTETTRHIKRSLAGGAPEHCKTLPAHPKVFSIGPCGEGNAP